jgi:signal transduction histidine kinase
VTSRSRLAVLGASSALTGPALAALSLGRSRFVAGLQAMAAVLLGEGPVTSRLRRDLKALEELVQERTAELERTRRDLGARLAQLEAARLKLDASDRLIAADRLAKGLTHEINNPLAILLANLEFAAEELETPARASAARDGRPDEVRLALGEARQAGRRISLIVRELMSFSNDRSASDLGSADLAEALGHALRLAGPEIRRHATFETDLPAGPVMVQGNQARLGQVFLELLLGAASAVAEAARAGGRVSLTMRPEPGGAVVEVHDDGLPIPEELQPHLFDPFFTPTAGSAVGSAGLRGAGMGLASCFGIVQAAGGRLEVDSAAGSGTVFRVWLPAASAQSRIVLHGQAASLEAGRRRVLVVDVDPFDCATAYRTLSTRFDVAPHTSVSSALAVIRAGERFDLILCDPGSGLELVEALDADGSNQGASVVLVGDGVEPGAAAPPEAGPVRLERPISEEQVLELLRRLEDGRGEQPGTPGSAWSRRRHPGAVTSSA